MFTRIFQKLQQLTSDFTLNCSVKDLLMYFIIHLYLHHSYPLESPVMLQDRGDHSQGSGTLIIPRQDFRPKKSTNDDSDLIIFSV